MNSLWSCDAIWRQISWTTLDQVIPMIGNCTISNKPQWNLNENANSFWWWNKSKKNRLQYGRHFGQVLMSILNVYNHENTGQLFASFNNPFDVLFNLKGELFAMVQIQSVTWVQRWDIISPKFISGLILGLHPTNDRRRYFVTASLIGWVQAWNQPCIRIWEAGTRLALVMRHPVFIYYLLWWFHIYD